MSAKQWVEYINEREGSEYSDCDCNYVLMERYANFVLRDFHAALFDFRNKVLLNGGMADFKLLRAFDEAFNIRVVKPGDRENTV